MFLRFETHNEIDIIETVIFNGLFSLDIVSRSVIIKNPSVNSHDFFEITMLLEKCLKYCCISEEGFGSSN